MELYNALCVEDNVDYAKKTAGFLKNAGISSLWVSDMETFITLARGKKAGVLVLDGAFLPWPGCDALHAMVLGPITLYELRVRYAVKTPAIVHSGDPHIGAILGEFPQEKMRPYESIPKARKGSLDMLAERIKELQDAKEQKPLLSPPTL